MTSLNQEVDAIIASEGITNENSAVEEPTVNPDEPVVETTEPVTEEPKVEEPVVEEQIGRAQV